VTIINRGETLNVSGLAELGAANSIQFQTALEQALPRGVKEVQIDLSQTGYADCGGLGALVALRNRLRCLSDSATVRLLNPTWEVRRIIRLTRMEEVFPIEYS
jgi:anti-anti-sigma factor